MYHHVDGSERTRAQISGPAFGTIWHTSRLLAPRSSPCFPRRSYLGHRGSSLRHSNSAWSWNGPIPRGREESVAAHRTDRSLQGGENVFDRFEGRVCPWS